MNSTQCLGSYLPGREVNLSRHLKQMNNFIIHQIRVDSLFSAGLCEHEYIFYLMNWTRRRKFRSGQ